jgi:hypothetical protein
MTKSAPEEKIVRYSHAERIHLGTCIPMPVIVYGNIGQFQRNQGRLGMVFCGEYSQLMVLVEESHVDLA